MFKKFIFFLSWLGILILALTGINFVLFPDKYLFSLPILTRLSIFELKMIILVICVIYIFIVLYKFLSLFERTKDYEKVTENGIVKISNTTINNYVVDLLKKDYEISNIKVKSDRKGKKFFIYIKFQILAQLNVTEKISAVQTLVKDELNVNVGIEVKDVIVNISGLSQKGTKKKVQEETSTRNEEPEVN
ncbi:MAG: alkaline shock response membrane anchor protein AmaP [Fusobacterium sp.]|nr:alkaline shock response membrane anchor protein AmaP [Fusobacterium sp.]